MSAERATNVVQIPRASVLVAFEAMIDARVDARLKALGGGARLPTRKELRLRAGFSSVRDLAIAAQVSSGWISMLELGRIDNPGARSRACLDRLCAALSVEPYEYCRALPHE